MFCVPTVCPCQGAFVWVLPCGAPVAVTVARLRRPATLFSAEPCNQIAVRDTLTSDISLQWNASALGAVSPGSSAWHQRYAA